MFNNGKVNNLQYRFDELQRKFDDIVALLKYVPKGVDYIIDPTTRDLYGYSPGYRQEDRPAKIEILGHKLTRKFIAEVPAREEVVTEPIKKPKK